MPIPNRYDPIMVRILSRNSRILFFSSPQKNRIHISEIIATPEAYCHKHGTQIPSFFPIDLFHGQQQHRKRHHWYNKMAVTHPCKQPIPGKYINHASCQTLPSVIMKILQKYGQTQSGKIKSQYNQKTICKFQLTLIEQQIKPI